MEPSLGQNRGVQQVLGFETITMQPTGVVPQELSDIIIDHLHNDKPSLKNCSLVCKAWTDESQHHLFSRLVVGPRLVGTTVTDLVPFLSSTPAVAVHVKDLVVSNCNFVTLAHLREMVISLPNMSTFTLHKTRIVPVPEVAWDLPCVKTAMKTVSITHCTTTTAMMLHIIGFFSTIHDLVLDGFMRSATFVPSVPAPSRNPPALVIHQITATQCNPSMLKRLARMSRSVKSFTVLACIERWDEADVIGNVFYRVRSTLKHINMLPMLFIHPPGEVSHRCLWKRLRLSDCTALEVLDFGVPARSVVGDLRVYMLMYSCSFLHLPPSVRVVTFVLSQLPDTSCSVAQETAEVREQWETLDETLADATRAHMRFFVLVEGVVPVPNRREVEELCAFLKVRLPRISALGRLAVV
ncbi:hypothetical protein C8Q76DRAFT_752267 [Earliella scabrosa]|nr:hypothetical protein C8Q76DRAFT_752267 [Earliella scabrosa]